MVLGRHVHARLRPRINPAAIFTLSLMGARPLKQVPDGKQVPDALDLRRAAPSPRCGERPTRAGPERADSSVAPSDRPTSSALLLLGLTPFSFGYGQSNLFEEKKQRKQQAPHCYRSRFPRVFLLLSSSGHDQGNMSKNASNGKYSTPNSSALFSVGIRPSFTSEKPHAPVSNAPPKPFRARAAEAEAKDRGG